MTNNNSDITIRFSGKEYENRDYTISELMRMLSGDPIIKAIENGVLFNVNMPLEQLVYSLDLRNKTFENIYSLAKTIAEELISNDLDIGEEIPRKIHQFWAGGEMSEIAMNNILKWYKKAKEYNWEHFLWTDSNANQSFNNEDGRMTELQTAGVQILDFSQLLPELPEESQKAYNILLGRIFCKRKRSLLFISDLARYTILYHYGGVYSDVDVDLDNISLKKSLKHRDSDSEIPMLGPCFRTCSDAKASGYLDEDPGAKEAAALRMYNKTIFGNHFIATRAGTDIMRQSIENATKSLKVSNYNATLGPGDIVKAMYARNNNIKIVSAQAIPPWLFDINWITEESNNIVI